MTIAAAPAHLHDGYQTGPRTMRVVEVRPLTDAITHYRRLFTELRPDRVHVLLDGRVVRSGGRELALELEESGYSAFGPAPAQAVA